MRRNRVFSVCLVALWACGGDSTAPNNNNGPTGGTSDPCQIMANPGSANASFSATGLFTVSPLTLSAISSIAPLGNLNPPIHVYPTDHMFIIPTSAAAGANQVFAAAPGTVLELYQPGGGSDWKVMIKADKSFYYYYDHITPAAGLAVGSAVTAGQVVGTNSGQAGAVDFGVYNFNNTPLPGILNACLLVGEAYVDSPLKYFSGATQTSLYAKVNVTGAATKDGKIDYDQAGKLVGNWVLTGHKPVEDTKYSLSFVYNVLNHAMRVSAGVLAGGGGSFGVQQGAPDWATITPPSGQVNYRLFPTTGGDSSQPGSEFGVLAVQMLSATQIKVEVFPGNLTGAATFTANALIYDR